MNKSLKKKALWREKFHSLHLLDEGNLNQIFSSALNYLKSPGSLAVIFMGRKIRVQVSLSGPS